MRASLIPLGFDGMSAEAQLRARHLLFCARHLAMTFRPGSVLPPPGWCPFGAHVFFAGFGDPKPIGWAESAATGGGIYGYKHDEPCREGGGTTHHLWCEPCEVSPRRRSALNLRARSPQEPQDKSPNPAVLKSSRLLGGGEGAGPAVLKSSRLGGGENAGPQTQTGPEKVQKRLNFEA